MLRFLSIILLVVLADQATKYWIVKTICLHESVPVIAGLFSLTYLHNTGAAFGILAGQASLVRQFFFIAVALIALCILFILQRRLAGQTAWYRVAFGLIGGGAVGNLLDRIRYGSVVDFLDFHLAGHHWPAFNVADSAISIGVGLAIFLSFHEQQREKAGQPE